MLWTPRRKLIRLGSPLAFPGGFSMGFNKNHPAAQGILGCYAPNSDGFVDLLSGKPGSKTGTPTPAISPVFGVAGSFIGSADNFIVTGSTNLYLNATIAGFVYFNAIGATSQFLFSTASGANAGYRLSANLTGGASLSATIGATTLNTLISLSALVPYFIAFSSSGGTLVNVIVVDLRTGVTRFASSTPAATPVAGEATWSLGNLGTGTRPLNGLLGPLMYSSSFLSMPILAGWAADPWLLWMKLK